MSTGNEVVLKNLTKVFNKKTIAVDNINLVVKEREFICLLGPSGCGKTTTLRMIAGLEDVTKGEIYIGGKLVNDKSPKNRDISMVFQTYAIWPHMTVFKNLSFPLEMLRFKRSIIKQRVNKVADLLEIRGLLNRMPGQLSGGEAQRVALGRAIVREPKVFLLDEPLANLDAKLRIGMRVELYNLQKKLGVTTIFVTHDQVEAMSMADRIVIINEGKIVQIGSSSELYENPANFFVASFIGSPQMNFIECTLDEKRSSLVAKGISVKIPESLVKKIKTKAKSPDLILGVRPDEISICGEEKSDLICARVSFTEMLGREIIARLEIEDKIIQMIAPPTVKLAVDDRIKIKLDISKINIIDKKTEKTIA
ncbi:MAG: ABC transporter ATP-binding protein [Actinomycetota bacterium]|nr:ABC transporter ATP-binding protein [Actinomycetota bacterium]